jgi:hypothetical protein
MLWVLTWVGMILVFYFTYYHIECLLVLIDWLIDWCLMPTLEVFQL